MKVEGQRNMKSYFKIFIIVELLFIIGGMFAFLITNLVIRNEELELMRERNEQQKIHTVYKNCFYDDESNTRREFEK